MSTLNIDEICQAVLLIFSFQGKLVELVGSSKKIGVHNA